MLKNHRGGPRLPHAELQLTSICKARDPSLAAWPVKKPIPRRQDCTGMSGGLQPKKNVYYGCTILQRGSRPAIVTACGPSRNGEPLRAPAAIA